MEEVVGRLWDRLITGIACSHYPQAMVSLEDIRRDAGLLFRAFGGDAGFNLEPSFPTPNPARRGLLQRVAGIERHVELAWCDDRALRLPRSLALFPDADLNRDLYLWLAALAAVGSGRSGDWFAVNQWSTRQLLAAWPGLAARYHRLLAAHLGQRPDPAKLPPDAAAGEQVIRRALRHPGSEAAYPLAVEPPFPVYLWLHPLPPRAPDDAAANGDAGAPAGGSRNHAGRGRRRAERVRDPKGGAGLIAFRLESLFSWGEYAHLDRTVDEGNDDAQRVVDDVEVISVSRNRQTVSGALRFDLDLPGAEHDDLPLGGGVRLPEWDCRQGRLRTEHCLVQPMVARDAPDCDLPQRLQRTSRRLRRQFQALQPARRWLSRQTEGEEIDIDAVMNFHVRRRTGAAEGDMRLYRQCRQAERDMACLLLADLSLSTDAWINNDARVIDVIKDSLFLFSESLAAVRDRFAVYGFSSRNRDHVRLHLIKSFHETYHAGVRGRIEVLRPGFYTRMGAAIRYATRLLEDLPIQHRLLVLLTDGKPNDLDCYEGRYGTEDTRMAVIEARRGGLHPFCVTIDEQGQDYLPHLFGAGGFVVMRRPAELPDRLPALYAQLTGRFR